MDVDHLSVFLSVVRLGSFAAVAKAKNRDPSWVSRVIAGLESELDITLFKRSNRMLILTEAGERYAARVAEALEKLDHAHEEAKAISREISGRLVITASTAFGHAVVVPIVLAFKRHHPEIILDLRFCDHTMELKATDVDLAFRLAPSMDEDLCGTKLWPTQYYVCCSKRFAVNGICINPENISASPVIAFDFPGYKNHWLFKSKNSGDCAVIGFDIKPEIVTTSMLSVKAACLAGAGLALMPDWLAAPEMAQGLLFDAFPDYRVTATNFDTGVWLLYPKDRYRPERLKKFIDFVKNYSLVS